MERLIFELGNKNENDWKKLIAETVNIIKPEIGKRNPRNGKEQEENSNIKSLITNMMGCSDFTDTNTVDTYIKNIETDSLLKNEIVIRREFLCQSVLEAIQKKYQENDLKKLTWKHFEAILPLELKSLAGDVFEMYKEKIKLAVEKEIGRETKTNIEIKLIEEMELPVLPKW